MEESRRDLLWQYINRVSSYFCGETQCRQDVAELEGVMLIKWNNCWGVVRIGSDDWMKYRDYAA